MIEPQSDLLTVDGLDQMTDDVLKRHYLAYVLEESSIQQLLTKLPTVTTKEVLCHHVTLLRTLVKNSKVDYSADPRLVIRSHLELPPRVVAFCGLTAEVKSDQRLGQVDVVAVHVNGFERHVDGAPINGNDSCQSLVSNRQLTTSQASRVRHYHVTRGLTAPCKPVDSNLVLVAASSLAPSDQISPVITWYGELILDGRVCLLPNSEPTPRRTV